MAQDPGFFTIDLKLVGTVVSDLEGLVCSGSNVVGEVGSLLLDAGSFAGIGSLVGSANSELHSTLMNSLTRSMQLLGTLNGAVQCCANDYAALDSLVSDSFGGQTQATPTTPTVPARGSDPAAVKQWWTGLSDDQRRQLLTTDPTEIGALDGVPAAERDIANRAALSDLRQRTQQQLTDAKNMPVSPYDPDSIEYLMRQRQIDALQTKLDGIDELQKVLRPATAGTPPKYLLEVDTKGVGHAIVASNNPDTADNVVTVVPGVGTDLSANHVREYTTTADSVVASAHAADASQTTSAVAWMDYDAPATVPGALFSSPAIAGGPVLDHFQQSLYATHDPADPIHTTVIGHSYGTTLVGEATQAPGGLRADDVVLAASPGTDVDNAAAMHTPGGAGHVWATRDDHDPIVWAEGFHDTDPVTPAFGAHVFDAGEGPTGFLAAHSYYLDPSSPAMANFGRIATGHYGQVTAPPPVKDVEPVFPFIAD
ncbi:MAG: alpha/beta hydrolase [Catenulispora sp.]